MILNLSLWFSGSDQSQGRVNCWRECVIGKNDYRLWGTWFVKKHNLSLYIQRNPSNVNGIIFISLNHIYLINTQVTKWSLPLSKFDISVSKFNTQSDISTLRFIHSNKTKNLFYSLIFTRFLLLSLTFFSLFLIYILKNAFHFYLCHYIRN